MDLRIQLNRDLEYFFLKKKRQELTIKCNDVLDNLNRSSLDQTDLDQTDLDQTETNINALIKQHASLDHQADELWTSMCEFAKNKNAYREHYIKQIHKVLNKN